MYIHEATKEVLETSRYITREIYFGEIKVRPENAVPCIIMEADGSRPCNGWQPTAEDLMAGDWIAVD